jgi:WD40 repeat protein
MLLLQHPLNRAVRSLAFAPGRRTLAAWAQDGFAVWDLDTRQCALTRGRHIYHCWAFEFDPLGRWFYIADGDGFRYRTLSFGEFRRLPGLEGDSVASIAVSADGAGLVVSRGVLGANRLQCWSIGANGDLTLAWSRAAGGEYRTDRHIYQRVMFFGLALQPGGALLTALDCNRGDSPIWLFDASTGADLGSFGNVHLRDYRDNRLAFTPDGISLLVGDPLRIDVWDANTRRLVAHAPRRGQAKFTGFAIHPGGEFFATSAGDRCVRYWSLPDCRPRGVLKWDIGKLHSIALSRDGMLGAAGGQKGQIVVWDVEADG